MLILGCEFFSPPETEPSAWAAEDLGEQERLALVREEYPEATIITVIALTWECRVEYDRGIFKGGDGVASSWGEKGQVINCPQPQGSVKVTHRLFFYQWETTDEQTGTYRTSESAWQETKIGDRFIVSPAGAIISIEWGLNWLMHYKLGQ